MIRAEKLHECANVTRISEDLSVGVRVRRAVTTVFGCLAVLVASVVSAQTAGGREGLMLEAQSAPAPRPTPRPALPIGFRAYALFDSTSMSASETFDAVFDTTRFSMSGGGGEVLNLWKGLFARVAVSGGSLEGSRVAVIDDEVIRLGIPVTVEMRPIEFGAGWRFRSFLASRLTPYAGAGYLKVSYKETSDFADPGENTSESFNGSVIFGGIEARLLRWVVAGAEVQYRNVPDAIGGGGVSQEFGEANLGGVTMRVLVGVGR